MKVDYFGGDLRRGQGTEKEWKSVTPCTTESVTTVANGVPSHWWILGTSVKHTSKLFQVQRAAYLHLYFYQSLIPGLIPTYSFFRGPGLPCAWSEHAPVAREQPMDRASGLHYHLPSVGRVVTPEISVHTNGYTTNTPMQVEAKWGQQSSGIRWDFKHMNSWKGRNWFSVKSVNLVID